MGSMHISAGLGKQHYPSLIPLPLSPPVLKPSKRPPHSLDAPNPTTRSNFSPISPVHDFPLDFPISGYRHIQPDDRRPGSHSASASLEMPRPVITQTPKLKQRSPSQPHLPSYFSTRALQQPPVIPLRMSSIPPNSKPRKYSLKNHRSMSTIRQSNGHEEKESVQAADFPKPPRRVSPPLRTDKALPSPPMSKEEAMRTRDRMSSNSPPLSRHSPPRRDSETHKREGQIWPKSSRDGEVEHPGIAELPATSTGIAKSHSRLHSAPTSSSLTQPFQAPDVQALTAGSKQASLSTPPLKPSSSSKDKPTTESPDIPDRSKSSKFKGKASNSTDPKKLKATLTESGGWAAGTQPQPSRTQKEKERKKRSKAKVLCEHVDLIKDEFWEKRPWLLSGKTG